MISWYVTWQQQLNYSARHNACRITRPNMQREKESGIKWDQVGSSGIKWDQLLLCRCGLKRFWSNGVVWCEFLFVVRFFVNGAIWCGKPASGAVPHQPHQNMVHGLLWWSRGINFLKNFRGLRLPSPPPGAPPLDPAGDLSHLWATFYGLPT